MADGPEKTAGAAHLVSWDAGHAPYSQTFGDHFFSRADGRAECCHVFLGGNGLPGRWRGREHFSIAELGFGTGLNFLTTWHLWREARTPGQQLNFTSFEAYPLDSDSIVRAISPWPDLVPLADDLTASWGRLDDEPAAWRLDDQTTLTVVKAPALDGLCAWDGVADAWYLDGFSPQLNADMWSPELMSAVYAHTAPGGTFASYTAAGRVRRNLEAAGFKVNRVPGFARKRHMICGTKPDG